ncbi:MAG: FAD:protein FMN transferase [Chlamydiota bacterium]
MLLNFLLIGCSPNESEVHRPLQLSGNAMTMSYRILIGDKINNHDIEIIQGIISSTFDEVNSIYNIWNPESELTRLNESPGDAWIPLSPELEELLAITDGLVSMTHGYFDPTITSAYRLWVEKLKLKTRPNDEEIKQLQGVVGWDKVKIKDGQFWKSHQDVKIDLGGIAKGYCVDLLTERLIKRGFKNCYVEWGGEIRASGKHPEQRPWTVFISNLADTDPNHALAVVSLKEEALATSGDYLQQWTLEESDGSCFTYTHVIDPKSLTPIKVTQYNICSTTVKAKTCTEADALATAAMIYPSVAEAEKWTNQLREITENTEFWFVTRSELSNLR